MASHIDFGKLGEQLAENFLIKNGYTILYRNWRHSHYEIDIVALKNDIPHFVEVKTRSSKHFGEPEESLEEISWDEFFKVFDDNDLAFLYQDKTHDGKTSRFNKLIERQH